jgi:hypothetical protein
MTQLHDVAGAYKAQHAGLGLLMRAQGHDCHSCGNCTDGCAHACDSGSMGRHDMKVRCTALALSAWTWVLPHGKGSCCATLP